MIAYELACSVLSEVMNGFLAPNKVPYSTSATEGKDGEGEPEPMQRREAASMARTHPLPRRAC